MTASGLLDAIDRLADAVNRYDAGRGDPDSLVWLYRLRSDADVLSRLEPGDLERMTEQQLTRATSDVEGLLATVAERADLDLATVLSDRLVRSIGYVALAR